MINASKYQLRIYPIQGSTESHQLDRMQSIDPTGTINEKKIEELGRQGAVGYVGKTCEVAYRATQYEYGSIQFWQDLANVTNKGGSGDASGITINEFKTSYFDIAGFMTDDSATFLGTALWTDLRTSGFSINIPGAEEVIERNFDFVGDGYKLLQGDNKYYINDSYTVASGSDDDIDLSAIPPAEDPNNTGVYMLRVVRYRGTTTTELTLTTDYTYTTGTKILHIVSVVAGDIIKYYYTSATAPTIFSNNDTDPDAIMGDSASIFLYIPASGHPASTDYIYRLQNVSLDVRFTREDYREIGNANIIARGISDTEVGVTLGKILESFTLEEILAGKAAGWGILDIKDLSDQVTLIVKFFSDNTKTTFKYGIKATGLKAYNLKLGGAINQYIKPEAMLKGEDLTISANSTVIGI